MALLDLFTGGCNICGFTDERVTVGRALDKIYILYNCGWTQDQVFRYTLFLYKIIQNLISILENVNSGLSQQLWLLSVVTVNLKKICTGCIENRERY